MLQDSFEDGGAAAADLKIIPRWLDGWGWGCVCALRYRVSSAVGVTTCCGGVQASANWNQPNRSSDHRASPSPALELQHHILHSQASAAAAVARTPSAAAPQLPIIRSQLPHDPSIVISHPRL